MPQNLPITIIWDAESDSAPKMALAVALGGPTGKTWEKCEKSEKWQNRPFFRLLLALDALKYAYNHYLGRWMWFWKKSQNGPSGNPRGSYW